MMGVGSGALEDARPLRAPQVALAYRVPFPLTMV